MFKYVDMYIFLYKKFFTGTRLLLQCWKNPRTYLLVHIYE